MAKNELIRGNTDGIRDAWLANMAAWLDFEPQPDAFAPDELISVMADMTLRLNREIAVYLTREGSVLEVSIGDASTAPLRDVRMRRSLTRLSGVRCLHTHPGGSPMLSEIDTRSLVRLRLDAMAAIGVRGDGSVSGFSAAFLTLENGQPVAQTEGPVRRVPQEDWMQRIEDADRLIGREAAEARPEQERAILVGYAMGEDDATMIELRRLTETAGALPIQAVVQRPHTPDPATYIGKGKADELSLLISATPCEVCIFNDELSGAQARNLEERLGVRVIDRTALILDIFAQRAHSREGKLQVELAQLYYRLPRLSGLGVVLSRLGGGIGTRGPGETQLETDRRAIRLRIHAIESEIKGLTAQRGVRRTRRERQALPVVALVGYTNAGKSTLLTALSGAEAFAEDKLFATLDTLTRRVTPAGGREYLLVDTVGFIEKLPHDLVKAFSSTLEEVLEADVLVVVHDGLSPDMAAQGRAVDAVLKDLGADAHPRIDVLNKCDVADASPYPENIAISAKTGDGLEALSSAIQQKLAERMTRMTFLVPYARTAVQAFLHEHGLVFDEAYAEDGVHIDAELSPADAQRALSLLAQP